MATSEIAIMEGLADVVRTLVEFRDGSVVLFDQSVLDGPRDRSPYLIFLPADVVRARDDNPATARLSWEIKAVLFTRFDGWATALRTFSKARFSLLTAFDDGDDARSAGALANISVDEIRAGGPVGYRYLTYNPSTLEPEGLPIGIEQDIIFTVEDY